MEKYLFILVSFENFFKKDISSFSQNEINIPPSVYLIRESSKEKVNLYAKKAVDLAFSTTQSDPLPIFESLLNQEKIEFIFVGDLSFTNLKNIKNNFCEKIEFIDL